MTAQEIEAWVVLISIIGPPVLVLVLIGLAFAWRA